MLKANDVASVILSRCGPWTDAMKLQKLLYYVQAWHLAITDEPLFEDHIKAWAAGPVVPHVRYLRRDRATRRAADQKVSGIALDELASNLIDLVIASYGSMSGEELSVLTHVEQPWREARGGLSDGEWGDTPISTDSMARFYRAQRLLGGRRAADLAAGGVRVIDPDRLATPIDVETLLASIDANSDDPGENPWGTANVGQGVPYGPEDVEHSPAVRAYAGE